MNKRGMTLLEIVISLGILVIIVTSLTKVFTSGVSLTMESDSLSRSALKVRKAIAGEKIAGVKITAQDSSLTFLLDGQSYSIPGQMKTYSDAKGRVNYRYFEADPS